MTTYVSPWKTGDVADLASLAEKFFATEVVPFREEWEAQQHVDRALWNKAGEVGLLCCSIPQEYGGGGGTFAHDLAVVDAQARALDRSWGHGVHSCIVAHYVLAYGTEEQRHRWLPRMATGELVSAIAMSEPDAGSDLQGVRTTAVRDGEGYLLNGSKTFISNGAQANLIVVVAKTDPSLGAKGVSLLVVETNDAPGFERGRILKKVGQHGNDTSELFFREVRVPAINLLGGVEGQGFVQLMQQLAQERLAIAVTGAAVAETAVAETVRYTKQRKAFGKTIFDHQNTRFELAECATIAHAARVFIDDCIARHLRGELDARTAAMAKWWITEQEVAIVDRCVQLFGGYGYMLEYPIARMYADARAQMIYGGSNEIMKEIISRAL
jgi:acyl-CoA dehydrogenase